ncbi:hypothetical protein Slin15195_G129160 [Septoria linicola]|uniref:Uncharacterized protein n=1 Tax=Septoria linicola TaxID=215465 RepID=A0A9Q9ER72_9PEZI|nr:hypothetical protein Slin14017_G121690 [Septoria linicola]USW59597.1 hypothetical protein Slin15195_G129160 [Septoria linicola]
MLRLSDRDNILKVLSPDQHNGRLCFFQSFRGSRRPKNERRCRRTLRRQTIDEQTGILRNDLFLAITDADVRSSVATFLCAMSCCVHGNQTKSSITNAVQLVEDLVRDRQPTYFSCFNCGGPLDALYTCSACPTAMLLDLLNPLDSIGHFPFSPDFDAAMCTFSPAGNFKDPSASQGSVTAHALGPENSPDFNLLSFTSSTGNPQDLVATESLDTAGQAPNLDPSLATTLPLSVTTPPTLRPTSPATSFSDPSTCPSLVNSGILQDGVSSTAPPKLDREPLGGHAVHTSSSQSLNFLTREHFPEPSPLHTDVFSTAPWNSNRDNGGLFEGLGAVQPDVFSTTLSHSNLDNIGLCEGLGAVHPDAFSTALHDSSSTALQDFDQDDGDWYSAMDFNQFIQMPSPRLLEGETSKLGNGLGGAQSGAEC